MCLVGCPLLSHQNQHFGDYYKKATVRLENIIQPEFRLLFKSVFDIECRFYYRFYLPRSAERQNENDLKVPYWYCGNPTYLKYWYCGNPTYPHQLYMASTMPTKYGTQIWSAIFLLILLISHRPTSITYICATRVDAFACVIFTPPLLLSEVHQKWLGLTSFVCLEEDTRHWYVIVYNVLQYYHLNAGREGLLRIGHSFWAEWEFQMLIAKLLKSVENRPTETAKCKL